MNDNLLYSDNWGSEVIEEARKLAGPILIIGVSGFIGAKLFFSLRKYRDDVFACSRNPSKSWRLNNIQSPNIFDTDISDYENIKRITNSIKPQTVYNLAAYGAYSRQTDSRRIYETNYLGVFNIVKVLSDTGCSAFVNAGSSS